MSKWAEMTKEERDARVASMQEGRKRKRAAAPAPALKVSDGPLGNGVALESTLEHITWSGLPLMRMREIVGALQAAISAGQKALAAEMNKNSGTLCSACKRPFVNDRHFGEQTWHDHISGGIMVLRSCSPACQGKIEQMANAVKKEALEREHTRFNRR